VLALFAEEDEDELHRRTSAILRGLGLMSESYEFQADLRKNLFIKSMTAADNLMTKADSVGAVTRTDYAERLCATVKEFSDLKLIIIDPVSRFRGGNENYAEDATRFVEAAELIAKETGATVLLVHHANKASTKEGEQNQTAARGSSALTDGVRFQMNLAPLTDKQADELGLTEMKTNYVAVKVTKSNYARMGDVVFLQRGEHGVLTYHEPQQAQRDASADRVDLMRQLLRGDAEKGRRHSKSGFAKHYSGTDGPFKMGQNRLEKLIGNAIDEGYLLQEKRRPNILSPTDKPSRIVKAKIVVPHESMESA
jgi:RecA-family ATPase